MIRNLAAVATALALAACSVEPQSRVPLDDITATMALDGRVTLTGSRTVRLQLNLDALDVVYSEIASIDGDRKGDLVRWFSPALYRSLGQASPAYLIYTSNGKESDIRNDVLNWFAAAYPVVRPETATDRTLARTFGRIQRANNMKGRPTCTGDEGGALLADVEAGMCFVACSGAAIIVADHAPGGSRVLLLQPRIDEIAPNVRFTRSEGHTTPEIKDANGWYVFGATFGFAWVKDRQGNRLDAQGLIRALAEGRERELTFAMLTGSTLHAVPGEAVLRGQPTLAGLYYTADKRIEVTAYGRPHL